MSSGVWRQEQEQQQQQEQQPPKQEDNIPFDPPFNPTTMNETYNEMEDQDSKMTEIQSDQMISPSNGNNPKEAALHGIDGGKIRKKRKRTVGEKNMRLKKYVKPKNAVMCLNELMPGIVYNVETDENGIASPTKVSVQVEGKKFIGSGSSKQNAKQEAAEKALVSFVKPPPSTDGEPVDEDNTPWAVLACFAMYKLFNKWIGDDETPSPNMMMDTSSNFQQIAHHMPPPEISANLVPLQSQTQITNDCILEQKKILSTHLGKPFKESTRTVPNPAKECPANADSMHPMMLLHQMRPGLQLSQTKFISEDKQQKFRVTADIEKQTFVGEGKNMKKAKYDMAVKANKTIFEVDCTYTAPQ